MRLFIAVDMSDEVRERIASLEGILKKYRGLKPVENHNIHITLRFLGEVPEVRVGVIKDRLSRIYFPPFKMHLKGIGFFPNANHVRVVWVGVEEGKEEITKLANAVGSEMKKLGFKEDKPFVAHATIARIKRLTPDERRKLLEELNNVEDDFGWMSVEDFRLKKSTLTPKGPIYDDVEIYPLREKE
ncbi:2'-5' RNA ligase [Archaeoglobus veneficus SNP6]|uniref:RNA 2',3'-cyclic phosphodiesterase n=2 Tax=Archaeoglobus veneficus TaxID=58290 RepID=F2KR21_ARCVS|nr:2'-5' RNA ligase [Archaeoglobus veneficus SNP6]